MFLNLKEDTVKNYLPNRNWKKNEAVKKNIKNYDNDNDKTETMQMKIKKNETNCKNALTQYDECAKNSTHIMRTNKSNARKKIA